MKWLVTVDNGRHGEDHALAVVDDRVDRFVLDDVEVVLQLHVRLATRDTWHQDRNNCRIFQISTGAVGHYQPFHQIPFLSNYNCLKIYKSK